ncbi:MAG: pantetheine-phosphate adenylyltransferase [Bacteroidetes bacterium CG2_30_32_10]|nr:MAG: pantetheine-phosphate adenylyltransferase [Bacteroidetes bacterium CG2_30_32_10]
MKKIAIFPGSFDPITKGHESIVKRAIPLFDEIVVAIGENSEKKGFFTIEQRLTWIEQVFKEYPTVKVRKYKGLTVEYCKDIKAKYIIRGLRTAADFEFERSIGQMNKLIYNDIETVFLLTTPKFSALNSSIVRDIIKHGGNVKQFVPDAINIITNKQ